MLTAAATAATQVHEPARESDAQQHIVGCFEVADRAGPEHEGTQAVALDVVLDITQVVLHGGTPHFTAHEGLGAGTPQLIERHALPLLILVGHGHIAAVDACITTTHCLQVLGTTGSQIVRWDPR